MIRGDVYRMAQRLGTVSGIHADAVYVWLMKLGKWFAVNPKSLDIRAVSGRVYLNGEDTSFRLEKVRPASINHEKNLWNAPDYEAAILDRQECSVD